MLFKKCSPHYCLLFDELISSPFLFALDPFLSTLYVISVGEIVHADTHQTPQRLETPRILQMRRSATQYTRLMLVLKD